MASENSEASARLQERKLSQLKDYKRTFSSEQGQRVLMDLISAHHVMGSTYVKGDAIDMAFREGQRQVILRIMTIMKYEPDQVAKTIREADQYVKEI